MRNPTDPHDHSRPRRERGSPRSDDPHAPGRRPDSGSRGSSRASASPPHRSQPADPLRGAVLEDRYRVGARLARGGMSTVYRGMDLRLDRPVAIKIMTPEYAADPTFLARFEREARAAAMLDNPHVVGVYDQGRDREHVFLVMELIDGGTLRDLLRSRGSLPVPLAMAVLEPIVEALAAAHDAGLIHRDVKPENVLISQRGEVKVADFGLVRAVTSTTMATGNVILGTVAYLSPEQVETGASDERSDVYSAGIVGYEMLTGHTPFGGDNALSVAYQHVHSDVPPVADAAPGVPRALAEAIDAATSRDPLERQANAREMLEELRRARHRLGLGSVTVPVPRPTRPAAEARSDDHRATQRASARGTARAGRPDRLTAVSPDRKRRAGRRTGTSADPTPTGRASARYRRRWRRRAIALIIVLLVAAAAAFGGWWLTDQWTSTPSVMHDSATQAAAAVRAAGLVPVLVTRHDNAVPSGSVAAAKPSADSRQRKGATVSLIVSAGRPVVPEVTAGASVKDASARIRAADLTPATDADADIYSNTVPAGTVIRTDPPAGEHLDIDATVTLIRSRGPEPEVVPVVAGKLVEDAENKLLVDGFTIGPQVTRFDADTEPGTVIGTEPPAGDIARFGSPVSLVLSISKTVPDVSGQTVAAAAADLTSAGFDVTIGPAEFDAAIPGGDVLRIEPPAGTRIDPSDPAVTLIGSNAVTVPSVEGTRVPDARATLTDQGLSSAVSSLFGSDNGIVTGQFPEAGTLVEPHSVVQLHAWP